MLSLSIPDFGALAFFVLAWLSYSRLVALGRGGRRSLNLMMDEYRERWMLEMARRENRIVDSGIMGSLQSGTAFFTSTSLLAFGGAATLLRGVDDAVKVVSELSNGQGPQRGLFELKILGLLIIFGYAFFKFAWAYRLFNFTAILIGATPGRASPDTEERDRIARRAAAMASVASSNFSRGQRAFFFALAYFGWFVSPWAFIAMTALVVCLMWGRQFASPARRALMDVGGDPRNP